MARTADDVLIHYGVKGMKWGVRRSREERARARAARKQESEDYQQAKQLRKKKPSQMSNAELRKLNERMQLEQTYANLMSKQGNAVTRGNDYVKSALAVAKTGADVYNTLNSPAGKAAQELVKGALK